MIARKRNCEFRPAKPLTALKAANVRPDVPMSALGQKRTLEQIFALKAKVETHGLALAVIESVPVHEGINPDRRAGSPA